MADELPSYQRLTRPKVGFDGLGSLWLGPDHILQVTNVMTVEYYRRWYFRDIQSLLMLHTSARTIWNVVLCTLGALIGLGAGGVVMLSLNETNSMDGGVLMGMAILIGLPALLLFAIAIVNTTLGPTCTVFIQTPHGVEKLSCPKRCSTYHRLAARLEPEILKAQQGSAGTAASAGTHEVASTLDQKS
jgi:hypothetical protein